MGDDANDPIDHHRTTRTAKTPGLVFVAVAVLAFVICLTSFAVREVGVGVGAAIVALLAAGAALAWLTMEGRRVRQVQREGSRTHRDIR
jgi:protein-S-isoprenylcysteine O-methyltransferase Ste14